MTPQPTDEQRKVARQLMGKMFPHGPLADLSMFLENIAQALAAEAQRVRMTRDEILVHPKMTEIAASAAKQIGHAERLDMVSQKEVYRTVIEAIAAALRAQQEEPGDV